MFSVAITLAMAFKPFLLAALLGGATCIFAKDTLATWKAPAGVALNSDFTVKVRLQDGVWHTLSSYLIKVD